MRSIRVQMTGTLVPGMGGMVNGFRLTVWVDGRPFHTVPVTPDAQKPPTPTPKSDHAMRPRLVRRT